MPDLLLELFCEEIPARMQTRAAEDLKSKVTNSLVDAGLVYEGAVAHATPRRLALHIAGIPPRSPDVQEEKKGPRVGAPEAAIQGFLKSAGLPSIDQAQKQSNGKKGEFYVATINRRGRDSAELLAEVICKTVRDFPWPKSMRWGKASRETGSLRWVRPLHSILCTFGSDTETPQVVEFEIDSIRTSDVTYGHRFLSPVPCQARRYEDYVSALERAFVVLDAERRRDIILHDAKNLAFAQGFELIEDQELLEEVAGLVEWPVVLMGSFDKAFLDLPEPVIRTTIRNNQKCFVLRQNSETGNQNPESPSPRGRVRVRGDDRRPGQLANKFMLVANINASDGGKAIIAGNERVVRARLSDAKFFFEQDRKQKLFERSSKLDSITFHEKLGTQGERVQRIAALAREIAPLVGADPDKAETAAKLAKADLVTEMVGEFPELQGYMGRRYAELEGFDSDICAAIEDHYKPLGPADTVPANPVSIAVALADKLDMLVGFWAIDEKPTGSKDPFALRRVALGIIRFVLENSLRIPITSIASQHFILVDETITNTSNQLKTEAAKKVGGGIIGMDVSMRLTQSFGSRKLDSRSIDLISFFHDRLNIQLREQGLPHDVIDAVLALDGQDDLLMIVKCTEALDAILKTENGAALQAGVTRALNILKIEEKKDNTSYDGKVPGTLAAPEELALSEAIDIAESAIANALQKEDFTAAITAIAQLRTPIDAFFDKVMVNEEPHRANRLQLLARIRKATNQIADFGKLEG